MFLYNMYGCVFSPDMYQLTTSTIIAYLPTAFVFGIILLNNIVFGYILMSDCFFKSDDNQEINKLKYH